MASQAVARKDQARRKSLSERALSLLGKAIKNDYTDYMHMREDPDLDPIRDLPAFAQIRKRSHLDRSYASVFRIGEKQFEAMPLFGDEPSTHLQRCRELASQGYRIVSLSVARTSAFGPPITASVWHGPPVITDETRDRVAERQARSAIALLRMGKRKEVIPLLRHSADPRLRSFIINWLYPLGADPIVMAAELDRLDSPATRHQLIAADRKMDAVLFHPETSIRRALILALGTFGMDGVSPGEHEPLIGKLLDIYRDDPDSGIHGAAAWTLRQWKQQDKLQAADDELMNSRDPDDRRWYANSEGQTFAVVQGPVEFDMGSPPTEPNRRATDFPHRVQIPRRFALAAKEVTVEQYHQFVKETDEDDHAKNDSYSPDPKSPMNNVSWYDAAAYCNWLSRKEGLPVCYEPNESGKYAAGMRIKADALNLTGYRLPTEAEWEYACRSGAATRRYYGSSVDLLERYARYTGGHELVTLPCGSLLPNDLGCSDMLGNVSEWCQDRFYTDITDSNTDSAIQMNESEVLIEEHLRIERGGSFVDHRNEIRSACRSASRPGDHHPGAGFRLSRTYQ